MTAVTAARAGIVAGGALVGILSAGRSYDVHLPWLWATDLAVTITFAVVAALAVASAWRVAALAAGVSATWALAAWWPFALSWHRGVLVTLLVLLILGAESLWPRGRLARALIVVSIAVSITPLVWQQDAVALVLGCGLVVAAVALRTRGMATAGIPAVAALIMLGLVFAAAATLPLFVVEPWVFEVRAVGYASGLVAVGVLAAAAARPPRVDGATDAVVELGAQPDDAVRDRLASALRDPSLEIGWWSAGASGFFASNGVEVVRPGDGGPRRALVIESDGAPLAVVVGDPRRLDDAGVREAVLRASGLMAEHARLSMRLGEATAQVEESQRRLIDSATAERSALASELEHSVGAPLRAMAAELARLDPPGRAGSAADLVERALGELAVISRGLHPVALRGGLEAALRQLVSDAPLAVDLRVETEPVEEGVAQVAYYVCAEALANAVKHAGGTHAWITVKEAAAGLEVTIADDGDGGPPFHRGSGLRGLEDRVAGAGGAIEVSSAGGGGTVISARIPLALTPSLGEGLR